MFKTISAALLAASVLAAPAMAAGTAKHVHARDIKALHIKGNVRNAHAEMGYHGDRHHPHHHKIKRILRHLIHRG